MKQASPVLLLKFVGSVDHRILDNMVWHEPLDNWSL